VIHVSPSYPVPSRITESGLAWLPRTTEDGVTCVDDEKAGTVEVKIGIADSNRELAFKTGMSPEDVEKRVEAALTAQGRSVLDNSRTRRGAGTSSPPTRWPTWRSARPLAARSASSP